MNDNLTSSQSQPKQIVLWTAPRCVSTVFEKALTQHPEVATVHEPFQDVYYHSQWRQSDRLGDHKPCLNYGTVQVIEQIKSQTSPIVFMKDMAYHALPYIEHEFLDGSFVNTFLIRNPKKSLLSWYQLGEVPTRAEFGFSALQEMWNIVVYEHNHKPILIEADQFQRDPEKTLKTYCKAVGINFMPIMLIWNEGRIQQENLRKEEIHKKWHKTLGNSRGIMPPKEASGEIHSEDIPMLEQAVKTYELLSQFALNK